MVQTGNGHPFYHCNKRAVHKSTRFWAHKIWSPFEVFFFILRMTLTHTKSGDYFTSFWFISVHFLIAPTQGVHKIRIILHVSRMTADIDLRFGRIFHEQKQVHFLRLMTPPPLRLPSLSQGSGGNFRIFHKHHFSVIPHQKNDTEDDFSL